MQCLNVSNVWNLFLTMKYIQHDLGPHFNAGFFFLSFIILYIYETTSLNRKPNKRNGLHNASYNIQDHFFSIVQMKIYLLYSTHHCDCLQLPWKCYERTDYSFKFSFHMSYGVVNIYTLISSSNNIWLLLLLLFFIKQNFRAKQWIDN